MFFCEVQGGTEIIRQGDDGSSFFIIQKGEFSVIIDGYERRKLGAGDQFGELALLYNAPRSATIKATTSCEIWGIDRETFRNIVEEICTRQYEENRAFLDTIDFFKIMTESQKDAIAEVIVTEHYTNGDQIVCQGDQASSYYLIKSGQVSVEIDGHEVTTMNAGDTFGESALFKDEVRKGTCLCASDELICLSIGRETLKQALGSDIKRLI